MTQEVPLAPFEQVAHTFCDYYYATFDANRAGLASLYTNESLLTWEGEKLQGLQQIGTKLTEGLTFKTSRHRIQSKDAQPVGAGVLVFVSGEVLVDAETAPLRFSQVFMLEPIPGQQGGYFIKNEMFRLHYA